LSSSYVCTLFKSETGQTLNQYLTDYRIEKAKKLLQDPRYKITDISEKVGYTDGNYFGKTFKRTVGLSPSEYREKYKP
ncbi:MAG: helix-turn-helix transcriptional regulator, partial [Lachnospiraceae bacterium]|nr:helix-turn-helix transcriptional regulator [Lachnospiraceae bacterium]